MYPSVKQYINFEELVTFANHLRTNKVLKWSRPNKWVMYRCYEFHAILFFFFFLVIVGMVILAQLLQFSSCWRTMPLDLCAIWAIVQVNVLCYNTQHCIITCLDSNWRKGQLCILKPWNMAWKCFVIIYSPPCKREVHKTFLELHNKSIAAFSRTRIC